jgi:general secretion pathway protein C
MKRLPLIVTLLAVMALSASLAYWGIEWTKPAQRPLAAAPAPSARPLSTTAAAGLFGGQTVAATAATNYQLKGVVAANGRGSAAILAVDGQSAKAYAVGAEVAPGVTVREVRPRFVQLLDHGVPKRVELVLEVGKGGGGGMLGAPTQTPPLPPRVGGVTPAAALPVGVEPALPVAAPPPSH